MYSNENAKFSFLVKYLVDDQLTENFPVVRQTYNFISLKNSFRTESAV